MLKSVVLLVRIQRRQMQRRRQRQRQRQSAFVKACSVQPSHYSGFFILAFSISRRPKKTSLQVPIAHTRRPPQAPWMSSMMNIIGKTDRIRLHAWDLIVFLMQWPCKIRSHRKTSLFRTWGSDDEDQQQQQQQYLYLGCTARSIYMVWVYRGWLGFSSTLTSVTAFQPKERNEPVGDDAGLRVSQHAYTPQHFTFWRHISLQIAMSKPGIEKY